MKNVFLNVRTAKAQAGCAKLKDTSLSFRRGLGRGFLFTFLLLTLGVGQMWASEYAGGAVYFDNSVTNWSYTHVYLIIGKIDKNGKNDWSTTYQMEPMTGTSYYHVSLPKGGWSDATYIAVAAKNGDQSDGSWSDVSNKFTKYSTKKSQSGGLSRATYILTPSSSSNGFSFTLSSSTSIFSSCPTDVLNGTKIMVYAGEAWSWDKGFYRFMSSNNTSNTVATAAIRGIKKNLTNIGDVGFGPALLASGTYYQGHWASGLSQSISAGKAYMVYSKDKASYIGTALATSGDNSLYNVTKVNSSPTTSVTTTIGSSSFAEGTSSLSVSTGTAGKSVMNSTNTIEYYLYNGSTWSKVTVSAGSLNVSSLGVGSYKLATVLYDGYIYIKADEDDFEVTSAAADYTVTYDVHSSGHGSLAATYTTGGAPIGASPATVASGSGLTFSATPSTYYTVDGWYSDAACTVGNRLQEGGDTYTVASLSGPLTVYVKFKLIAYTITYYLNGGDNHEDNPETYTYETSIITLQDPSKTGYTFEGWYTEVGLTNRVYSIPNHSSGDKAFWAKWSINSYDITYSPVSAPTGATYTTTPSSAEYDSDVDVVITPTADNYAIQVTVEDENGDPVDVSQSTNTFTFTMPASNVTVTVSASLLPIVYVLKTKHANSSLGDDVTLFPSGGKIWAWRTSDSKNFYKGIAWSTRPTASSAATSVTDDVVGDTWYRFIPNNIEYFNASTEYRVILTDNDVEILNTNTEHIEDGSYSSSGSSQTGTIWVVPHGTEQHTAYVYTSYPDEIVTPYNVTYNAGDHGSINVFGTTITSGNSQTIATTKNRTLTATPASGYAFNRWITTGSVTVADATNATTTVSATGAGGTITATYFEEVNSGWYIKGNPAGSEWGTPTTLPLNRLLPGETDVYYRPVTLPANDQYFRFWHDETGKPEYGASYGNLVVSKDTKYDISKDDGKGGNAFKYSAGGTLWFVIDESAKKFWLQDPVEFYSVNFGYSDGCKTFSAKDGEGNDLVSGNTYVSGTALTFTQTKKDGYTFVGWNTAADGSGSSLGTGSSYTVASLSADVNVYAIYTENKTAITINTDGHGTITTPSPNNSPYSLGVATSQAINATASEGYHWNTWTTSGTAALVSSASTQSNTVKGNGTDGGTGTVTATFTPNTYTVRFHRNGGAGDVVEQNFTYGVAQNLTANTYTKTGYNFAGWALAADAAVTYADEANVSNLTSENGATFHLYAKWTPKQSALTFDYQTSAEGYGASGSIAAVSATYGAAMPALTGNMPTAAQGYAFMGFYSETGGNGTLYYNPDKTSAHNWDVDTESTTTLYAYYKKSEITAVVLNHDIFEPVAEATGVDDKDYVFANPTIAPTPTPTTKLCWELRYSNDNPVAGDDYRAIPVSGDQVKFKLVGLAAGGYKIHVELRTGSTCGAGTLLSSYDKSFSIASDHIVTVQYKCGDFTLKSPTSVGGKPLDWSEVIEAASITGYTFNHWEAGEGVTIKDDEGEDKTTSTDATIQIKAIYDSKLTAVYTKKRVIYFYNTLGWSNVYVYFYSNAYWNNDNGTGSQTDGSYTGINGQMLPIEEGSPIYYFDAEAAGVNASYTYVSFTELHQNNTEFFEKTGTTKNKVIYRGDYKSTTLPMFVPLTGVDPVSKNSNKADYYNEGYWMNYPENTGYTLRIYNKWNADNATGASREYMIPFSTDKKMPLKQDVEINFSGETWFLIYRNDGNYLQGSHTFKQNDHGDKAMKSTSNVGTAKKMKVISDAEGIYTFTLSFHGNGANPEVYSYYVNVEFPAAVGDYRIVYQDNATWSQSTPHDASWNHPSRVIPKIKGDATEAQKDTVSFFISVGSSPTMKFQKIESINATTGAVTWTDVASGSIAIPSSITESGVYNFIVTQPVGGASISLEKAEPYAGNFYIRTDGAGSTKWDNYQASDHQMTYTEFSMSAANSFGDKYSHYFMHWSPGGTNIKFVVANDYSPCISDTLEYDLHNWGNLNDGGWLKHQDGKSETEDIYSANVRFMYNQETNKISRAYVSSSTNASRLFLVLRGNEVIKDENGTAVSDQGVTNGAILNDKENWIYERILQIKPDSRFKLFACYAQGTPTQAGAQYFRGAYDSDNFTTNDNSVILISGTTDSYQKARVLYDFKTNRLVCAWLPSDEPIDEPLDIDADVMVIRDHQEAAECITFSGSGSKLTDVKTVYGVMKFNRWTLNNRYRGKGGIEDNNKDHCKDADSIAEYHGILPAGEQKSVYERSLYFISFPFDVKVSEIFGFGTYGKHWVLEYYDGLNRAKNGYWIDSPANWKYVTPSMAKTYELKAYEGYILCLSLGRMAYDNTEFWANNISNVELYFPSKTPMTNIQTTDVNISGLNEIAGDPYRCTINREGEDGDRRVKDSYWRCLGVPSYDMYAGTLTSDGSTVINWQTDYSTFPFLYAWNMNDNTLTPQSTNRFSFKPMHAYLTQIGTAIHWTNVSATPAVMARQTEEPTEYNWCLTLNAGEQMIDQTYVRMSTDEVITNEFDFGQDLSKELNTGRSDIYSFIGNERAAANSLQMNTETTTIVPLGLNIEATGDYTFSIPDGTNGIGITLIDEETGIRTSLSALDYTVELAAGDYTERFWLEISPVKGAETGIDPGVDARENGVRKVMIDGILYIVRDGKMYDARGARVE